MDSLHDDALPSTFAGHETMRGRDLIKRDYVLSSFSCPYPRLPLPAIHLPIRYRDGAHTNIASAPMVHPPCRLPWSFPALPPPSKPVSAPQSTAQHPSHAPRLAAHRVHTGSPSLLAYRTWPRIPCVAELPALMRKPTNRQSRIPPTTRLLRTICPPSFL
ncbi:hypothetical protein B0H19DRAFT_1264677 [Mycena capillaripes]|nr:hypothetical protein B0H19DRAFT_1264677 [Mycena capillaripes]